MRQSSQSKTCNAPQRPLAPPVTFICTACEAHEHRRNPTLPENWASETIGFDIYVYCPDCAIDLPEGQIQ